ncbi:hypothetical protein TURU_013275 [Turdus rufiventris]|nr:hypothetical protein TURU_013275 [Turdus rufiventris]
MDALGEVVSELHRQWSIECKLKDFECAITRLLKLRVVDCPVDILHPGCWGKRTNALANDVIVSGTSKCLKSWGKVIWALEKALLEQETWKAAANCLKITPKVGVAATTQTAFSDCASSKTNNRSQPQSPNSTPNLTTELSPGSESVCEPQNNLNKVGPEEILKRPPPYAPQNGAEQEGEGWDKEPSPATDMHSSEHEAEGMANKREETPKPNQRVLPGRRRKGGKETTHGKVRGWSPTKRYHYPEDSYHSTSSDSDSEYGWARRTPWYEWWGKQKNRKQYSSSTESDSDSDKNYAPAAPIKYTGLFTPRTNKRSPSEPMPLIDWKKVQTALVDLPETVVRIFPVRRVGNNLPAYSPGNPKDVQAVVKAIAEKGINSAMVSTLIDGLFGNDDMLLFDIKQTCCMIFDGAGMIVLKQEWEGNLEKMLARVSRDQHPLCHSSLPHLMGRDPQMVSPQAQAQGLRASKIAATTCAAKQAIRAAYRIVAKSAPWTAIRQTESERFTELVDRLQAAMDTSELPPEAKGPVLEGCLRQQCNQSTKELLRSVPSGASLAAMIKHVAREENLAPVKAAVGAALAPLPATVSDAIAEVRNYPNQSQPPPIGPSRLRPRGPCWVCGKKGHITREC